MCNSLKVTTFGTRGSIPVSNPESIIYGGNTTCLRVESPCIPKGKALIVDAGSGYVPCSYRLLGEKVHDVHVLFTHYHHDHTQGLLLAPPTFIKSIKTHLYGPVDAGGVGPKEMWKTIMQPPYFPVHHKLHESHFSFHPLEFPQTQVMLVHSQGGIRMMDVDQYESLNLKDGYIPIGKGKYPKSEILVISMYMSNHPENTICYGFDEGPTGKKFVFLTDHENHDSNPNDLKNHIKGADLLVMDCQYSRLKYDSMTAGYGHGTPDYCVRTAREVGAKRLGLTHHDPNAKDLDVEGILAEAKACLPCEVDVFTCRDYQEIEV